MGTWIVTGGAGFIGSNFVRYALGARDAKIVVLDKFTYAGRHENLEDLLGHPRFELLEGDIADTALVERAYDTYSPEVVVNFAAESHVDRSIDHPRTFLETNVMGAFELLEGARRYLKTRSADDAASFRILHVSTDEVYGSLGSEGLFSETTSYAPNSPYAASKAGADHLVRAFHRTYGLPVLLTNCSNNYGPYQFPEKLIPLMVLNALEAKDLPIYGDGQNIRDWLFVEDHCEGILKVLDRGRVGEKYNLGGESERTNLELVDTLCDILDRLHPAGENAAMQRRGMHSYSELKTFVPDRPGHDRRYAIDASKIQSELGWSPRHDLGAGLERTVQWYLDHRSWCEQVEHGRERLGLASSA